MALSKQWAAVDRFWIRVSPYTSPLGWVLIAYSFFRGITS